MLPPTQLFIRLTPGWIPPPVGEERFNVLYGGPETLLNWLETQLGLRTAPIDISSRSTEYLNALQNCSGSSISRSLSSDRWATGVSLLGLRDELGLAGWPEIVIDSLPTLVRDMDVSH